MNQSTYDRGSEQDHRLLYFDPRPDACILALDAAADLRLNVRTVSHTGAFEEACRTFRPTGLMLVSRPEEPDLVAVIARLATLGLRAPVLVASEKDVSLDRELERAVRELGVDLRGSVRLGSRHRDLQLSLLSAASRLGPNPLDPA